MVKLTQKNFDLFCEALNHRMTDLKDSVNSIKLKTESMEQKTNNMEIKTGKIEANIQWLKWICLSIGGILLAQLVSNLTKL